MIIGVVGDLALNDGAGHGELARQPHFNGVARRDLQQLPVRHDIVTTLGGTEASNIALIVPARLHHYGFPILKFLKTDFQNGNVLTLRTDSSWRNDAKRRRWRARKLRLLSWASDNIGKSRISHSHTQR